MKQRFYLTMITFSIVLLNIIFFSCKHKSKIDEDLYLKAKSTTNFVWYKNAGAKLPKSLTSGHSQPFLNTRYNYIAATNLDGNYKVKVGGKFPDESLIVKELYDESGKLELYAILYKNASHVNADSRGWVWGYINADGSVKVGSSKKGADCSGCHSQVGNEDYMLMNKFFP